MTPLRSVHGPIQAFATVGDWLGVGVANLVAAFDPDVVVRAHPWP